MVPGVPLGSLITNTNALVAARSDAFGVASALAKLGPVCDDCHISDGRVIVDLNQDAIIRTAKNGKTPDELIRVQEDEKTVLAARDEFISMVKEPLRTALANLRSDLDRNRTVVPYYREGQPLVDGGFRAAFPRDDDLRIAMPMVDLPSVSIGSPTTIDAVS